MCTCRELGESPYATTGFHVVIPQSPFAVRAEAADVVEEPFDPQKPFVIERGERTWSHRETALRLTLVGEHTFPVVEPCGCVSRHQVIIRHEKTSEYGIMSLDDLVEEYRHVDFSLAGATDG